MADISKEDLRKEITAILKDADLASTSAKKVRTQLEKKLDANLLTRKAEIDSLVMEIVNAKGANKKKKGKKDESEDEEEAEAEEEEEEEEEEDEEGSEDEKKGAKRPLPAPKKKTPAKKAKKSSESDASEASEGESEEEYSPKKSKPPKTRKLPPKKKRGSDSGSDEDWAKTKKGSKKGGGAKKGGSGYTRALTLSPELAALVGESTMPRHEVVKKVWAIIKERNLYDPKNKQYAICDDALFKVVKVRGLWSITPPNNIKRNGILNVQGQHYPL